MWRLLRQAVLGQERRSFFIYLILTSIIAAFEGYLIIIFYLFFKLINNPNSIVEDKYISILHQYSGQPEYIRLIVYFALSILALYFLKTCLAVFVEYFAVKVKVKIANKLSDSTMLKFMWQPYRYHVDQGLTTLRRFLDAIDNFNGIFLQSLTVIVTEIVILTSLIVVLLIIDFKTTIIVALSAGLLVYSIQRISQKGVKSLSNSLNLSRNAINQLALHLVGGVKEIKLLTREDFFLKKIQKHYSEYNLTTAVLVRLINIPRHIIELSFIAIFSLATISIVNSSNSLNLLPVMGSLAIAGFKILPALNRIASNFYQLRFIWGIVKNLFDVFKLKIPPKTNLSSAKLELKTEVKFSNVKFKYKDDEKFSLNIDQLAIKKGQTIGIVGKTGSGKSTFLDLLLGLYQPTSGTITINGSDLSAAVSSWQQSIGYVPQSIYLSEDTIRNNVAFGIDPAEIDEKAVISALKQAMAYEFVMESQNGLDTNIGERGIKISGGQRQRIGIARAIYHRPSILCLDEATSALDNATETEVMKSILNLHGRITIVIIAHRLSTLKNCDWIYSFDKGTLQQAGSYENIIKNS